MTDQNVQSGTGETVNETAPAPTQQESAKAEVGSLMSNKEFAADFSGANGRKAQVAAVAQKSALHETAYSDAPAEQSAPLPDKLQEGADAPDDLSKAMAESLTPAEDISDYSFTFANQADMEFEEVAQMHTVAAEAAMSIGANSHFAQETVKMLDTQLARQDNVPSEGDTEGNEAALTSMYGDNAESILDAADAAFNKMPENAQAWLKASLDAVDSSTRAWTIGRLARTWTANN
jgi:hypothetical protein